ncbi:MAG: Npun_F0494 family protein [Pleurocapsa sp.]
MTTSSVIKKLPEYSINTVKRAEIALSCSPFYLKLFEAMQNQSVPIAATSGISGVQTGYIKRAYSEAKAEDELVWLIKVGLLRREVDGQGLTDSFRLTPLGRQIVAKWEQQGNQIPQASIINRISNWFNRWLQWSL